MPNDNIVNIELIDDMGIVIHEYDPDSDMPISGKGVADALEKTKKLIVVNKTLMLQWKGINYKYDNNRIL